MLAIVIAFTVFLFAPLQALGVFAFQAFAILALLAIIAAMLAISNHPVAMAIMSVVFVANVAVFILRAFYAWPYNLHMLALAWFAISITLAAVVAEAVFRSGAVTYHRIVGHPALFADCDHIRNAFHLCRTAVAGPFKGISFVDNNGLASSVFYLRVLLR